MSSFFQFTQGTESRVRPAADTSPLLGRFRAVPPSRHYRNQHQRLIPDGRGSVHVRYGALLAAYADDDDEDEDDGSQDDEGPAGRFAAKSAWQRRLWHAGLVDLWVDQRQAAVKRVVDRWWSRYGLLVFLPAALAVIWCSLPFPQYPLPDTPGQGPDGGGSGDAHRTPGHGAARVEVNFWFFLFVYYGPYNLTALVWITKVFNLYSLNWWPQALGFPLTVSLIAVLSLAVPVPIYFSPQTHFLTSHNTAWISWTFIIMAMPVAIAFIILMTNERHISFRHSLSETRRIFTTWWTGEPDGLAQRDRRWPYPSDDDFGGHLRGAAPSVRPQDAALGPGWFLASFVRFLWFCVALFVGLMAYVIGEAYAEIYLRTLPHNNLETVVYVYGWVVTVHLLDALTAWVLGIREGERVGSYPLSWVFKLYFTLTYQTYVRALYARLRSPQQFIILQVLSSTSLVVFTPLTMTRPVHRALTVLGLNGQSYGSYQKLQTRNVFIRFLAENASIAAFLGSILVLHYGANQDVYPYFAFDDADEPYDFHLTFQASAVTWACELVASLAVRALIRVCFDVDIGLEGKLDLAVWPELLPTCVTVMLHVLQNMLFSIIRLQFYQ